MPFLYLHVTKISNIFRTRNDAINRGLKMDYKTMKVPADVWRSIKMGAAREGVTMIEYLRRTVEPKEEYEKPYTPLAGKSCNSTPRRISEWFCKGDVGMSSIVIASFALGIDPKPHYLRCPPSDAYDFNRCLQLIKVAPEVKEVFPLISKANAGWAAIIDSWDEVEKTLLDECGDNLILNGSTSRTYSLMKRIYRDYRGAA